MLKRRSGSGILWLVGAALAGGTLISPLAVAAGLAIRRPSDHPSYAPGAPVTVEWAGASSGGRVNVHLVDIRRNAVVGQGLQGEPDDGSTVMVLPRDLRCGDDYRFYVERADRSEWAYGGDITIRCGSPRPRDDDVPDTGLPDDDEPHTGPPDDDLPDTGLPDDDQPDTGLPDDDLPSDDEPLPPEADRRLCGYITNETYDRREPVVLTLRPGMPFAGQLTFGELKGGGNFVGERRGGICHATTHTGLPFEGRCTADRLSARWAMEGQVGRLVASRGACKRKPVEPKRGDPKPPRPVPDPPYPVPDPPVPPSPDPRPPTPPVPPGPDPDPDPPVPPVPPVGVRLCGTVHSAGWQPASMTLVQDGGFRGAFGYAGGAESPFAGTNTAGRCRATTADGVVLEGICDAQSFAGHATINGAYVILELSRAACGR